MGRMLLLSGILVLQPLNIADGVTRQALDYFDKNLSDSAAEGREALGMFPVAGDAV